MTIPDRDRSLIELRDWLKAAPPTVLLELADLCGPQPWKVGRVAERVSERLRPPDGVDGARQVARVLISVLRDVTAADDSDRHPF